MIDSFFSALTAIATTGTALLMFWQKYTTPLKGIEIEGVSSMPFEEHTYIRIKIRSKSSTHVSRLLIPGHKIAAHPREDFLDSLPIHTRVDSKHEWTQDVYVQPCLTGSRPIVVSLDVGLMAYSKHELYPSDVCGHGCQSWPEVKSVSQAGQDTVRPQ